MTSLPSPENLSRNTSNHSDRRRKRAAVACTECRSHKVRCDVLGQLPCVRCRIAGTACITDVQARKRRMTMEPMEQDMVNGAAPAVHLIPHAPETPSITMDPIFNVDFFNAFAAGYVPSEPEHILPDIDLSLESDPAQLEAHHTTATGDGTSPSEAAHHETPPGSYSDVKAISQYNKGLTREDIAYLASKHVYSFPSKSIQDELIDAYFLYVHPLLPILHEHEFREDYASGLEKTGLLLYRAMVFVATSYLKDASIEQCGFSSIREAQSAHFQRARLAFDFDVNTTTLPRVQSLLLFSYRVVILEPRSSRGSLYWLSSALNIAKDLNLNVEDTITYADTKLGKMMKRTWWACVVRDMYLAFTYRRAPLIHPHDYNVRKLVLDDFLDDSQELSANQSLSMEVVANLFIRQTELAILGHKHLHASFAPGAMAAADINTPASLLEYLLDLDRASTELRVWKQSFLAEELNCLEWGDDIYRRLTMHRNFVLIGYNIICIVSNRPRPEIISMALKSWSESIQILLQDACDRTRVAASDTVHLIEELVRLGLTKSLHISLSSMLACAAMIQFVDYRLQNPGEQASKDPSMRLCFHALESMQRRFTGVEVLIQTVNAAVASLEVGSEGIDGRAQTDNGKKSNETKKRKILAFIRATAYFDQATKNFGAVPDVVLSPSTLVQYSLPSA